MTIFSSDKPHIKGIHEVAISTHCLSGRSKGQRLGAIRDNQLFEPQVTPIPICANMDAQLIQK